MNGGEARRGRIVVVGGGAVGLAFAAACGDPVQRARERAAAPRHRPRALRHPRLRAERRHALVPARDRRVASASPAERITEVARMEVFGDDGHSRLDFTPPRGRALAWIVEGNRMSRAIEEAARERGATILPGTRLRSIAARAGGVQAVLDDGTATDADLLVGADGADSWVRGELGLASRAKRYPETAVVAHFRCERPPAGVARQWFRADGILAWLPLAGERMSIVWSAREGLADELAALDAAELARRVRDAGGAALGDLVLDSAVARFPLRLIRVPRIAVPGAVLIGDAAHGVHPLAGQGVNLGFQDARRPRAHARRALPARKARRPGAPSPARARAARRRGRDAVRHGPPRVALRHRRLVRGRRAQRGAEGGRGDFLGDEGPFRPRNAIITQSAPPGTSLAAHGPIRDHKRPYMKLLASLCAALVTFALALPASAQDLDRIKVRPQEEVPRSQRRNGEQDPLRRPLRGDRRGRSLLHRREDVLPPAGLAHRREDARRT